MNLAEYAERSGLARVGARPPLKQYVAEVWQRRTFIYSMARFRIASENQQNSLGMLWVVIKPLLNALVYGLIFGVLLGTQGRPPHFVSFLIIGVFVFEFFASAWTSGGKSITNNAALVQSLSFPRMVLPLEAVTQCFLQFLPTIGIMLVILLISGVHPTFHWLLIIPLFAIYYVFNCGLALITARLSVHWRDLNNFLPFMTRLIFYTTGIFFSVEQRFQDHPTIIFVSDWQPIHQFLSLARACLLEGPAYAVDERFWYRASLWAFGLFAIGVVFFWKAEERYGRVD